MIITPIKAIPTYQPKPELTFKSDGTGALLGWGAGLSTGFAVTIGAAISGKKTLPAIVNIIAIVAAGVFGAILGGKIEQGIKKFDKSV